MQFLLDLCVVFGTATAILLHQKLIFRLLPLAELVRTKPLPPGAGYWIEGTAREELQFRAALIGVPMLMGADPYVVGACALAGSVWFGLTHPYPRRTQMLLFGVAGLAIAGVFVFEASRYNVLAGFAASFSVHLLLNVWRQYRLWRRERLIQASV